MNQEQVTARLLELEKDVELFTVTFSGKKSKKVDGLYKPEKKEIILHNKNFNDDNALIYTAIHEFAHHIQFTKSTSPASARVHSAKFWNIFHNLLFIAEKKNIFLNIFKKDKKFIVLTERFKKQFLSANGHLMKEFGRLLLEAYELCRQFNVSFEDYVDRELQLHRTTAKTLIKMSSLNINPEIGYENMKIVARIKEPEARDLAEAAFATGQTPDMVRASFIPHPINNDDSLESLLIKKQRIERNIKKLSDELADVKKQIEQLNN